MSFIWLLISFFQIIDNRTELTLTNFVNSLTTLMQRLLNLFHLSIGEFMKMIRIFLFARKIFDIFYNTKLLARNILKSFIFDFVKKIIIICSKQGMLQMLFPLFVEHLYFLCKIIIDILNFLNKMSKSFSNVILVLVKETNDRVPSHYFTHLMRTFTRTITFHFTDVW